MIDKDDMFQMEIAKGEMAYACNIFDYGFDSIEEVNNHISYAHNNILNLIIKKASYERDDIIDNNKEGIGKTNVQTDQESLLNCKQCGESMDGNSEV